MRGAEAIAWLLKEEGTEYLFCFPDNLLIDPAAALGIRPIMPRMERTAVAMADGYARVLNGKRPAVVSVQYGPGIESSFGGVAQAYADSTPLLVFCGHTSQRRIDQPPYFDPTENFANITKWAARINTGDRIPQMIRRAFSYLRTGRPGPVLLDIPSEVARAEVPEGALAGYVPVTGTRTAADPADVAAAAHAISSARMPLIHAGQGVLYAEASEELIQLAELLEAPVMTTLLGKSAFPEDHPLSAGCGGLTGTPGLDTFLRDCDVVIAVGASLTASLFAAPIPPGKVAVQITVDDRDLNKDYPVRHPLMGDARLVLRQLLAALGEGLGRRPGAPTARESIRAQRMAAEKEWGPILRSDEIPISPYRVIREMSEAFGQQRLILTHDSGRPRDQLVPFWKSTTPRSYLGWGRSTQLGHGFGLAMGAKLAAPDKLAVHFMGDSAFGMIGMELETAARLSIPITAIVLNNGGMSGYESRYPHAYNRYQFKLLSGDYTAVGTALGVHAQRIVNPANLAQALRTAVQVNHSGRPALIEVMTKEESRSVDLWSREEREKGGF